MLAKLPKKIAEKVPDYTPAGCNATADKPNTARCFALVRTDTNHRVVASASGPAPTALTPADIKDAYKLPDGGQGQTVAVVDAFGYSSAEDDLATFRSEFGLPACTSADGCFRKVDQRGATDYPADDPSWGEETALDLDAVSSACPQCHILLVEGDSASTSDMAGAVKTAISLGAKFVSNSYGLSGESPTEDSLTDYEQPGVVVTASSGDVGNVVNWPASDPDVVAVGGTTLARDASTPRGWTEGAWNSGGSGCSEYEPQPSYQADLATDCTRRAIADISADADPASGLAVYDTLGEGGWLQVGGTSLSSPLVAAMYALAGSPAAGTFPVTYPYADQGNHLFDVTSGSDGPCGNVLCQTGTGWDGPTGLGSPDGVSALTMGPHGTVSGKVTDTSGGGPVSGASVVLTDAADKLTYHATTDSSGNYGVAVSAGTYDVTASKFGYNTGSLNGIAVAADATVTGDLSVAKVPSQLLTGKVTDASGHDWPLYAKITIDGYPDGAVYTNPKTGEYSVDLPDQADYTLHVAPVYPGYGSTDSTVRIGTDATRHDVPLTADQTLCEAPGYRYPTNTDFEDWSGTTAQDGWSVTNNGTQDGWYFDDPSTGQLNVAGTGDFARADPYADQGAAEDTDLVSPSMDFTDQTNADLHFDASYISAQGTDAEADLSTDGGTTWTTVWQPTETVPQSHIDIPLTQALGKSDVKVRFHFNGAGTSWFELDNVTVGKCGEQSGSLLEGTVTDANTGQPVNGATITDQDNPQVTTASAATPDDMNLSDGFYWLFSPTAGEHTLTATAGRYAGATVPVTTTADEITATTIELQAGRLKVSPGTTTLKEELGHKGSAQITLTNTGGIRLHVALHEQSAPSGTAGSAATAKGAPLQRVKGVFPTGPTTAAAGATAAKAEAPAASAPPSSGPWQRLTDYPEPIMDNATATYQGKTYSVGGIHQTVGGVALTDGYVYDPATQAWSPIAPLPEGRQAPAAAFVDGTMYVAGGWAGQDGVETAQSTVYAYHPASDTWTRVADLPEPLAGAAAAHGRRGRRRDRHHVPGSTRHMRTPVGERGHRRPRPLRRMAQARLGQRGRHGLGGRLHRGHQGDENHAGLPHDGRPGPAEVVIGGTA
jgi:hypothetical protein